MYRFVTPKRRRVVASLTKPFTATRKAKIVYLRLTTRKAIVKGNYLVVATGNPAGPVRRASTSNRFRLR